MKEKIIKFIIIALVAFFSARMAYGDTVQQVRYPYIERIDIGYSPQAFSTDSITRVKNTKVIRHAKEEEESISYGKCVGVGILYLVFVIMVIIIAVGSVLGLIGISLVLITAFKHKKSLN